MPPAGLQRLLQGGVELIESLDQVVQHLLPQPVADQDLPAGLGFGRDVAGDGAEAEVGGAGPEDEGLAPLRQLARGHPGDLDDVAQVGPLERLAQPPLLPHGGRPHPLPLVLPGGDFLRARDAPGEPGDGGVVPRARGGVRETERQAVLAHLQFPT